MIPWVEEWISLSKEFREGQWDIVWTSVYTKHARNIGIHVFDLKLCTNVRSIWKIHSMKLRVKDGVATIYRDSWSSHSLLYCTLLLTDDFLQIGVSSLIKRFRVYPDTTHVYFRLAEATHIYSNNVHIPRSHTFPKKIWEREREREREREWERETRVYRCMLHGLDLLV